VIATLLVAAGIVYVAAAARARRRRCDCTTPLPSSAFDSTMLATYQAALVGTPFSTEDLVDFQARLERMGACYEALQISKLIAARGVTPRRVRCR
jgi:hypothetical protein